MASRRTRIKGIANIPQRRKTITNNANSESSVKTLGKNEVDHEPNLNSEQGLTSDLQELEYNNDKITKEIQPETATNDTGKNTEIEICQTVGNIPAVNLVAPSSPKLSKEKSDDSIQESLPINDENLKENSAFNGQKPPVPVIRKFIKPTIAFHAISRKPKEIENDSNAAVIVNPPHKNNKIIILNEIITNSKQTQDIVINNCVPNGENSEKTNLILKPPDFVNGRTFIDPFERDAKRLVPNSPQLLSPEIEYPIPPPSPNKVPRPRIKAAPHLGQRHTSFSASESEDESRRNYRHRNDSVCSSASGLQDTSISECFSLQKPTQKEFNSVIQRKCRRTEQSRKLAEARRDFYLKFGNKKPDRQKLTMIDLIFYNPVSNPMSNEGKNKRRMSDVEVENEENRIEEVDDDSVNKTGSDEENEIPAPQIKIGPQGELVVDEQSLVIENKSVKKSREEIEKSQLVNGDFETGYGVYKRAKRSKDWSKQETLKFYKALNTIGTDFTLMCDLFPRRSRRELKMKFKKEERINKALVDKAIMEPCGFDFNDFKHEVDMEEKELREIENQKEQEKVLKLEARKRKASQLQRKESTEKQAKLDRSKKKKSLDILDVLDDDSDADESEVESLEDDALIQNMQKPTRSGRIPKILNRYRAPESEQKSANAQPGSLIVVGGTGANGQPVYKVCMVTGDYERQQIGDDMDSLDKALACKENGITNLFTLSATTTNVELSRQDEIIPPEEKNVTIPADEVLA